MRKDLDEKIALLSGDACWLYEFVRVAGEERNAIPIIIGMLAWLDGDDNALKPWPQIERFFQVRSEPAPAPLKQAVKK